MALKNFKIMHFFLIIDTLDFGGAERQVVLDANALVRRGQQVTVGFFRAGPLEQELDSEVVRKPIVQTSVPMRILAVWRIITHLKVDLVIAHMFRAEVVSAFAGFTAKVPVIFNEHGLGLWRRAHHKWMLRFAAKFAREIWCASDICRRLRVEKDKLRHQKVRTVYNFFDLMRDAANGKQVKIEILTRLGKASDTPIIGFVGRFDPVKRLLLLVDAATRDTLQSVVFVLVGDGPDREPLQAAVRDRGLEDRFYFPGFVTRPGDYFDAFDVFALPSKRESLSVALLEACGAGLPAIAFDVGGNAEIIEHGVTGYVVADGDFAAFELSLGRLAESTELRRDMGRAAARKVLNMFTEQRRMDEIMGAATRYVRNGGTA
jgi:glycosyltransferase involved in cell wall biosynthesis